MTKIKVIILSVCYLLGFIVNIFFVDSEANQSDIVFFDMGFWGRMLLFLVPTAYLWIYLGRKKENWWIDFFNTRRYRENDIINAENVAGLASLALVLIVLALTLLITAFLNEKYIRFFVDSDYYELDINKINYITMHHDLLEAIYAGDSSTNIYCVGVSAKNSKQNYRVCCEHINQLPENRLQTLLKVRVSQRNAEYFYPICPADWEIQNNRE